MDDQTLTGANQFSTFAGQLSDRSEQIQAAAPQLSEIDTRIGQANKTLLNMAANITEIETRLRPVLNGGTGSSGQSPGAPVQEQLSPLGSSIRDIEAGIEAANKRLVALLASLAL